LLMLYKSRSPETLFTHVQETVMNAIVLQWI